MSESVGRKKVCPYIFTTFVCLLHSLRFTHCRVVVPVTPLSSEIPLGHQYISEVQDHTTRPSLTETLLSPPLGLNRHPYLVIFLSDKEDPQTSGATKDTTETSFTADRTYVTDCPTSYRPS